MRKLALAVTVFVGVFMALVIRPSLDASAQTKSSCTKMVADYFDWANTQYKASPQSGTSQQPYVNFSMNGMTYDQKGFYPLSGLTGTPPGPNFPVAIFAAGRLYFNQGGAFETKFLGQEKGFQLYRSSEYTTVSKPGDGTLIGPQRGQPFSAWGAGLVSMTIRQTTINGEPYLNVVVDYGSGSPAQLTANCDWNMLSGLGLAGDTKNPNVVLVISFGDKGIEQKPGSPSAN